MKRAHLLALASLFFSCFSHAGSSSGGGAWGSSGGELLKDANNPWWVRSTTQVRYCVDIDPVGFSASRERVEPLIEKAIAYWKRELTSAHAYLEMVTSPDFFMRLGIGQQEFAKVPCDGSEDLRFRLGYGTLTDEQREKMGDARQYIGLAARTEYDEVQLRGRGFIFLASDQGPYQYNGGTDLVERPWDLEVRLFLILLHELGHAFGLPHGGAKWSLMSQQFPEFLMMKGLHEYVRKIKVDSIPSFFFPGANFQVCMALAPLKNLLGMSESATCAVFQFDRATRSFQVFEKKDRASPLVPLGRIEGIKPDLGDADIGIMVRLTEKQKVFELKRPEPLLLGPMFIGTDLSSGVYTSIQGEKRPIALALTATHIKVFGIVDGAIARVGFGSFEPDSEWEGLKARVERR